MKAISFEQTGEPSQVLTLKEIEKPKPGLHEVRIKMLGSPFNPADELFIKGQYRIKPLFPQTAGLEGAGIIDSVGEGVDLQAGSLVAFLSGKAWAEYVIVPVHNIFSLPEDFLIDKAAQFSLNPITAWGLLEEVALKENDWLLVTAGNSTVSKIITQLATERKINIILTVRNQKYSDELKSLGAKAVINVTEEQITKRVSEITNGAGANGILDSVGGKTGSELFHSAAVNGKIIIYGLLSADKAEFSNATIIYKNLTIKGFGIRGFLESLSPEKRNEMRQSLIEIIGKESFRLNVAASYPLEKFNEAISDYHKGGKIIFRFNH
jgi:NADPH:quinone reductase